MGREESSWVCSIQVKVRVQSPNSFFIFSNQINSRTTVSYSKDSTNTQMKPDVGAFLPLCHVRNEDGANTP